MRSHLPVPIPLPQKLTYWGYGSANPIDPEDYHDGEGSQQRSAS